MGIVESYKFYSFKVVFVIVSPLNEEKMFTHCLKRRWRYFHICDVIKGLQKNHTYYSFIRKSVPDDIAK